MRKVWEVLRLRLENKLALTAIAQSTGMGRSTVGDYVLRFRASGLPWPLPAGLDEFGLEARLFPSERLDANEEKVVPDFAAVAVELRRKAVTLRLLWEEYQQEHGSKAYQYSWYCERFHAWRSRQRLSMRQEHRGGEKMFADFSGDGLELVKAETGEVQEVKLFVAVLGASSFTYACALEDETCASWLRGMTGALEAFGGVPAVVVPDNPKTLVQLADRHEPLVTAAALNWAGHYGTCIIPARPYKPKDKAKVESGVLLCQRWVLAVLRNSVFHSLRDLNEAIATLTEKLNRRVMKGYGKSRRELFELLDVPALKQLPRNRHEYFTEHKARVHPDYHVQSADKHFYSVPYIHRGKEVYVRLRATSVEILLGGECVATHVRSKMAFGYTTLAEHMPSAHQAVLANTSTQQVLARAERVGPCTHQFSLELMARRPHPEHAIKGILGVLALVRVWPIARVEAACARALRFKMFQARSIKNILRNGLDQLDVAAPAQAELPLHNNIRGGSYFVH